MSTAGPAQLFLLSDHIKLTLLERQRASSFDVDPSAQNAEISRSLKSFRDGLEALEAQQAPELHNDLPQLRKQYDDLMHEFDGSSTPATAAAAAQPNDPCLTSDFSRASQALSMAPTSRTSKSVRFRDDPNADAAHQANRAALMPFRDDPDELDAPDHSHLDNQQIHEYHTHVMRDQDEQLDRLGASVGRQRELSIAMGDELEAQNELLDDVDQGVTRHSSQLDRAHKRVGKIARKAKDNLSVTIIISLVVILILLLVITK
ncbi:MAG: hypothetical protein Q9162_005134 [Coniocarpon cinnabarinum]